MAKGKNANPADAFRESRQNSLQTRVANNSVNLREGSKKEGIEEGKLSYNIVAHPIITCYITVE